MGRIVLPNASASGSVATQTKIENLDKYAFKMKLASSFFNNVPGDFQSYPFWFFDKGSAASPSNTGGLHVVGNDGDHFNLLFDTPAGDATSPGYVLKSDLPAGDVVIYGHNLDGLVNLRIALRSAVDGTVILESEGTHTGLLETGAGTGFMQFLGSAHSAIDLDGFALYSDALSSADEWSTPTISDTNLVAFFGWDEGSGTTTADLATGNAMSLVNHTWSSGGSWNAAGGGSPDPVIRSRVQGICFGIVR